MFRIYEIVDNNENKIEEHGYYKNVEDTRKFCFVLNKVKPSSTFVLNYKNEDGGISEEYFGDYTE